MNRTLSAFFAGGLALAGCAGIPADVSPGGVGAEPATSRGPASQCVRLFQRYDHVEDTMSTPTGFRDRMTVLPELSLEANRLRQAGCITKTADLTGLDAPPGVDAPVGVGPISPTAIHAGVVTNMNDDARVREFFTERGVRARSVGSSGLGRRVYLGPFNTRESLQNAVSLAGSVGFVAPYPARF